MKYQTWWVAAVMMTGCGGSAELGQADPEVAVGADPGDAQLASFGAWASGMCGLTQDGRALCWGKLGSTDAQRVPKLDGVRFAGSGSQGELCAVQADGKVLCTNAELTSRPAARLGIDGALDVALGFFAGCALIAGGGFQCWNIQEGGPIASSMMAAPVDLPSPVVQIAHRDEHGCAVTADGRVFCFGSNHLGESGQPLEVGHVSTPTAVPDIDDAKQVALGMEHTCVLHSSGKVTCFGDSSLVGGGLQTNGAPSARVDVPGIEDAVAIASSRISTCVITSAARLVCWGESMCGSLGIAEDCENTLVASPLVVQQQLKVQRIGMDDGYNCAVDDHEDVWCWGFSGWDGSAKGDARARRIAF